MRKKQNPKPTCCPKCGGEVYELLWGEPMMSEDDYFHLYGKHVIYAGCCIAFGKVPKWQCSKCGERFYEE
jgi:hypothetical protein